MNKHPSKQDLENLVLQNQEETVNPVLPFPILALDYGEKWCGFAWSPDGVVSIPLEVHKTEELSSTLKKIVKNKNIKQLVLGLPMTDRGLPIQLTHTIRNLGNIWNKKMPVSYVNERGSSKSVLTKITKREEREDDLAAQNILSYYLAQK